MADHNPPGPDHRAATPNRWIHNPDIRQYLYLVVAMVIAALVVFRIVTEEQIAEWARVTIDVLAVLATLLAARNVPSPDNR